MIRDSQRNLGGSSVWCIPRHRRSCMGCGDL